MSDITHDKDVKELFELLTQTGSTLLKRDILKDNSDNKLFKKYLDYLLNPFLTSGISSKKLSRQVEKLPTRTFADFSQVMEYLHLNNTGSDEIIANVQQFLHNQEEEMQEFYASIITKSAKLGCDIKSVNKAYGYEFIPQWEVQQSYSIDKYPIKDGEWFSLSLKLNGVRGTYYDGKLISRQGKEFSGLEHIISDIELLFDHPKDVVLDGELIRKNQEGLADNENFRLGTGLLAADDADKSSIMLIVFDYLTKAEFIDNESNNSYKDRLASLIELQKKIEHMDLQNIGVVEVLYSGYDNTMIETHLNNVSIDDKEGLMLNRDSKYYRKRHNGILKIKRFHTVDLEVISVVEGSGRLKGMLGAFIVDYKGNELNVGSGMSDQQRSELWACRETLTGRIIEVKYKEESRDKKTGLQSLQFPIFLSLREEGKEVSYF